MPRTPTPFRNISVALVLIFSMVFLASCTDKPIEQLEPFDPNTPVKLKVMFNNKDYFSQRYGNLLSNKFPNIEFEVVEPPLALGVRTKDDQKKEIITTQPDVLLLTSGLYEELATEGHLMELDPVIQQDKFDLTGIYTSVTDMLREGGGGKLYGLAPEFSTSVLYYNKDLFQRYGVDLPTDRMTWEDVLKLAQRFPSEGSEDERIYGYQTGLGQGLFDFVLNVGNTIGLTPVSSDGSNIVIASDNWKTVFESVMQAYQSDVLLLPRGSMIDEIKNDLFLQGRVAMKKNTFAYHSEFEHYRNKQQDNKQSKESKPFQFDVVTIPVDPANPDMTDAIYLGSIYAVNNKSTHKRAAWEVVKYINSEEHAKLESKTLYAQIPSRKDYVPKKDEINIEPFFALRPVIKRWSDSNTTPEFNQAFSELGTKELRLMHERKKTLDEVLQSIQTEGQQLLVTPQK